MVAILAQAVALRFYNFASRILWFDEIVTASMVRINNLGDLVALTLLRWEAQVEPPSSAL